MIYFWNQFVQAPAISKFLVGVCVLFIAGIIYFAIDGYKSWKSNKRFFKGIDDGRKAGYSCEDCRKDIDFFFEGPAWVDYQPSREQEEAQNRALGHMTAGSTHGKHNIDCQKCWDYYEGMKRKHCGG